MAERPDTRQLTIDDCAELSRRISERSTGRSDRGGLPAGSVSPGIDRPLTRLKDYADWTGHEARIKLTDAGRWPQATDRHLDGVEGERITIDVDRHQADDDRLRPGRQRQAAAHRQTDRRHRAALDRGADEEVSKRRTEEEGRPMATAVSANRAELIAIANAVATEKMIDAAS